MNNMVVINDRLKKWVDCEGKILCLTEWMEAFKLNKNTSTTSQLENHLIILTIIKGKILLGIIVIRHESIT